MTATDSGGHWVKVPHWVVRTPHLDPFETTVFMLLLSRANARGEAWPSRAGIMADTGISRGKVRQALARLEALGLVAVVVRRDEQGGQRSNLYRVKLDATEPTSTPGHEVVTPDHQVTPTPGHKVARPPARGEPAPSPPRDPKEDPSQEDPSQQDPLFEVAPSARRDAAKPSPAQLRYLCDLSILSGLSVPSDEDWLHWADDLSADEVTARIEEFLRSAGRGRDYLGPTPGTSEFEALSPDGKAAAEREFIPAPQRKETQ